MFLQCPRFGAYLPGYERVLGKPFRKPLLAIAECQAFAAADPTQLKESRTRSTSIAGRRWMLGRDENVNSGLMFWSEDRAASARFRTSNHGITDHRAAERTMGLLRSNTLSLLSDDSRWRRATRLTCIISMMAFPS